MSHIGEDIIYVKTKKQEIKFPVLLQLPQDEYAQLIDECDFIMRKPESIRGPIVYRLFDYNMMAYILHRYIGDEYGQTLFDNGSELWV